MTELMDMLEGIKLFMAQAYGTRVYDIPLILFSDCKDLVQSLLSLKQVQDKAVLGEVVALKQMIAACNPNIEVRLVATADMIADGLTKGRKAAGTDYLREVITTGRVDPPGGLEVQPHKGQFSKLWVSLNPWPRKTCAEDFESEWTTVRQPGRDLAGAACPGGPNKGR